jgi:hypothetical protein
MAAVPVKREVNKSFNVKSGVILKIDTEYSDIKIVNHAKPEIDVNVVITVNAKNEKIANEILDKIEIKIKQSASSVEIETEFKKMTLKNVDLDIDIEIFAPVDINLVSDTEFGDLSVGEIHGTTNIEAEYGAVNIRKLMSKKKDEPNILDFEFCDPVIIGVVKRVKISAGYSNLKIKGVGVLSLNADFTKTKIEKSILLRAEINYGSLYVGEVKQLIVEGDFIDINIGKILKTAKFEMDYGSLEIDALSKGFKKMLLTADYLDAKINMNGINDVKIVGNVSMVDVDLPKYVNIKKESFAERSFSGGNRDALLKVNMEFGSLEISE